MGSLKKQIELKCKQCTYDATQPGSWRHQVEECTVRSCPLWEIRPLTMETILIRRKGKVGTDSVIDALVAGLEDDEDEDAPIAVAA